MIRKAFAQELPAVAEIYSRIHDEEEAGRLAIGWNRSIYPTAATAGEAFEKGELFVLEEQGKILAAAKINKEQVAEYDLAQWLWEAPPEEIMVLHTLVVDPREAKRGCGTEFVAFYEQYAREQSCSCLRMDTNEKNAVARALYKKLGYREADIVDCVFNGIPGVDLVCMEKRLG